MEMIRDFSRRPAEGRNRGGVAGAGLPGAHRRSTRHAFQSWRKRGRFYARPLVALNFDGGVRPYFSPNQRAKSSAVWPFSCAPASMFMGLIGFWPGKQPGPRVRYSPPVAQEFEELRRQHHISILVTLADHIARSERMLW